MRNRPARAVLPALVLLLMFLTWVTTLAGTIAIQAARLIDGTSDDPLPNVTVLVEGTKIRAVTHPRRPRRLSGQHRAGHGVRRGGGGPAVNDCHRKS